MRKFNKLRWRWSKPSFTFQNGAKVPRFDRSRKHLRGATVTQKNYNRPQMHHQANL